MGVAQFGSALEWGSRGRGFKSLHPYQKKILHNSVGFFFAFSSLNEGLERVGIADTMAILVACLRQMVDTHRLPPRRDSVAEQVPSPIGLSYICVNASYIAFGSYICLWQVILLTLFAVVVEWNSLPPSLRATSLVR